MSTPTLWVEPATEPCRYDCGGTSILGPPRYNATRTAMNQSSTCQQCKRVAEVSHNLTLPKAKRKAAAA